MTITSTQKPAPTPLAYFLSSTFRAFNTNKTSWIGLAVFLAVALAAILAPAIAPFDPLEQDILSRLKPPTPEHWLSWSVARTTTFRPSKIC